jgi:hypothetical protein
MAISGVMIQVRFEDGMTAYFAISPGGKIHWALCDGNSTLSIQHKLAAEAQLHKQGLTLSDPIFDGWDKV